MSKIKHIELPIEDIILVDENPRDITQEDLQKLADDIENDPTFLYQRPSLINKVDGKYYCYAGTQRIKAQKLLGKETAICFVEENVPSNIQDQRMLKDNLHQVKVIVSFADRNQNHVGTIYQATNWIYIDERASERGIILNGKLTHRRSINKKYGTSTLSWLKENVDPNAKIVKGETKIKYVFPMDRYHRKKLSKLAKPYPKKEINNLVG